MRSPLPSLLALLAFTASLAQAQPVAPGEPVPGGDRLVGGGSVRHDTPVDGDLVGVGGDFELVAPVTGKAMIAAGNVLVRERVGGDLFAGGGNVLVTAMVGGHARIAGGNVELSPASGVGGDLSVAGGDVAIRGPVTGSVHVGAGNVTLDTAVGGNVHAATGELILGPNARISGRLTHRGAHVRQDPAAVVAGGVQRARSERHREHVSTRKDVGGWMWTAGLVAMAALLAGLFPAATRRVGGEMRAHPGMALVFGFVALVCVPAAALILMITIIGLPVALVVLLLYFVLLLVGYASAGVMIGDFALARLRAPDADRLAWRIGAAVAAMLLLAAVAKVPFLGGLVVFAALLAGIGAIVLALTHRRPAAVPPATAAA
ncbi:MAG TPA: hypothetical protein VEC19_06800 [Usitatibacter sp.]|nr:hypothetical protein [Usitatibacter sp.]